MRNVNHIAMRNLLQKLYLNKILYIGTKVAKVDAKIALSQNKFLIAVANILFMSKNFSTQIDSASFRSVTLFHLLLTIQHETITSLCICVSGLL